MYLHQGIALLLSLKFTLKKKTSNLDLPVKVKLTPALSTHQGVDKDGNPPAVLPKVNVQKLGTYAVKLTEM